MMVDVGHCDTGCVPGQGLVSHSMRCESCAAGKYNPKEGYLSEVHRA